ncbi:hypothetical protein HR15_09155 [Porphyromonas gulae]|uniref:Uncharacterized protein n=1 Tax=Porphyromonas gulae TaxID=111105 RepID=A0A0A2F3P1_9PORP|nr:hypothetical protein HR15_09155 [Porphyromonas gulae]
MLALFLSSPFENLQTVSTAIDPKQFNQSISGENLFSVFIMVFLGKPLNFLGQGEEFMYVQKFIFVRAKIFFRTYGNLLTFEV